GASQGWGRSERPRPSRARDPAQAWRTLWGLSPLRAGAVEAGAAIARRAIVVDQAQRSRCEGTGRTAAPCRERTHLVSCRQGDPEDALSHGWISPVRRTRGAGRYFGAARRSHSTGHWLARGGAGRTTGRGLWRWRLHRDPSDDVAHRLIRRG